MQTSEHILAATFVEPRGMVRSAVAATAGRQVLGALGSITAERTAGAGTQNASPLQKGDIAHLSVSRDELRLCKAKRGAFKPKPTDEVIASAPRTAVRGAKVDKGRLASVLEVSFEDGSSWAFDIPKIHLKGAQQIAAELSAAT
jgi:allophanate hydrolase subunit 2